MSNRNSWKLVVRTLARSASQEESLIRTKQKTSQALSFIVILSLLCNTPRLLLNLMDHFFSALTGFDFCNCALDPFWFEFFVLVIHLFLVINSAVNFLIYFSVCKMFKKGMMEKINLIGMRLRILGGKQENKPVEL